MAIFQVLLSLSAISLTIASRCTDESINECIEPMKKFNLEDNSAIVPRHTKEEISAICKTYYLVDKCLGPITSDCGEFDRQVFKGIKDHYDYVCKHNYEEYLLHQKCFDQQELHDEGDSCSTRFSTRIQNLVHRGSSDDYYRSLCHYANEYLDCVWNAVHTYCGEEAADWQRGLDEALIEPMLNFVDCQLYRDEKGGLPTGALIGLICAVIVLLLLIVIIIALYAMRQRKLKRQAVEAMRREQEMNTTMTASAPPYATYGAEPPGADGGVYVVTGNEKEGPSPGSMPFPPPEYVEKELPPPSYVSEAGTVHGGHRVPTALPVYDNSRQHSHRGAPPVVPVHDNSHHHSHRDAPPVVPVYDNSHQHSHHGGRARSTSGHSSRSGHEHSGRIHRNHSSDQNGHLYTHLTR